MVDVVAEWQRVAELSELTEDDVTCVEVEGRELAIYYVDGEVFATDNLCSHGHACLSDGFLDGYLIECPLHQGLIDIRNGAPAGAPVTEPVASYQVRIDGESVLLKL